MCIVDFGHNILQGIAMLNRSLLLSISYAIGLVAGISYAEEITLKGTVLLKSHDKEVPLKSAVVIIETLNPIVDDMHIPKTVQVPILNSEYQTRAILMRQNDTLRFSNQDKVGHVLSIQCDNRAIKIEPCNPKSNVDITLDSNDLMYTAIIADNRKAANCGVFVSRNQLCTLCNDDGYFSIRDIPKGEISVKLFHPLIPSICDIRVNGTMGQINARKFSLTVSKDLDLNHIEVLPDSK